MKKVFLSIDFFYGSGILFVETYYEVPIKEDLL